MILLNSYELCVISIITLSVGCGLGLLVKIMEYKLKLKLALMAEKQLNERKEREFYARLDTLVESEKIKQEFRNGAFNNE